MPWSSADEYLISAAQDLQGKKSVAVYNDTFGYLALHLLRLGHKVYSVNDSYCSLNSIQKNLQNNQIQDADIEFIDPLTDIEGKIDAVFIKVPKSSQLFELYLNLLSKFLHGDSKVYCAFMTKNFNQSLLKIASRYFSNSYQSQAVKKARLLTIEKPLFSSHLYPIRNSIIFDENKTFEQYYGVFSSDKIDYASQFLIESLIKYKFQGNTVLDLASGNGILAYILSHFNPKSEIHLMDDSFLAVESSKLNLSEQNYIFHHHCSLENFDLKFDLIVSNPPFHIGYENNIEVPLSLFEQVAMKIKENGIFVLVANLHLNYKTHLIKWYQSVEIIDQNDKFVIYRCQK